MGARALRGAPAPPCAACPVLAALRTGCEQADGSNPEPANATQASRNMRSGFWRAGAPMVRNGLLLHIGRSGGANGFARWQQNRGQPMADAPGRAAKMG